jgi:hypothetical protein
MGIKKYIFLFIYNTIIISAKNKSEFIIISNDCILSVMMTTFFCFDTMKKEKLIEISYYCAIYSNLKI